MNKVILMGRLTRDPESRLTQNSLEISRFSLACQSDYNTRDGERPTEFVNCVAFGNTANVINRYCQKGRMICVQGRIRTSSYDAQDGTKRYSTEVVVEQFEFTGGSGQNSNYNNSGYNNNNYDNNSYGNTSYNSNQSSNVSAYSPSEDSNPQTADITEDPYKEFGGEYTLSSDDLPF